MQLDKMPHVPLTVGSGAHAEVLLVVTLPKTLIMAKKPIQRGQITTHIERRLKLAS